MIVYIFEYSFNALPVLEVIIPVEILLNVIILLFFIKVIIIRVKHVKITNIFLTGHNH